MELSNEQRELISAYLDGEVNASERALAKALLERSEAASYFDGLKRIRELTQTHGAAKAPKNFAALVCQSLEGDFDGISRPTSNSGDYDGISRPTSNQTPIHSLPQATWRMPLLAAAAAIVMALSIFAFNALVLPNQAPSEVAQHRSVAPVDEKQGYADLAKENGTLDDHNEEVPGNADAEALKKTESASRNNDEIERAKRKKTPDDAADNTADKVEGKKAEEYARRSREPGKEGSNAGKDDNKNATPEKSEKWREGKEDNDGAESDGVGVGGGSGGAGSKNTPESKGERNDRGRTQGDPKPAETPAPQPPAADTPKPEMKRAHDADPAQDAKSKEIAREVTIEISGERAADSPSVATDLMQVASVYGDAKTTTNERGTSIEIEVGEDQVEEMVEALRNLAKAPAPSRNTAGPAESQTEKGASEPARARDYLPRDLRGAVDRDANKDKPKTDSEEERKELEKPKASIPAEGKKKVRVVVRLK